MKQHTATPFDELIDRGIAFKTGVIDRIPGFPIPAGLRNDIAAAADLYVSNPDAGTESLLRTTNRLGSYTAEFFRHASTERFHPHLKELLGERYAQHITDGFAAKLKAFDEAVLMEIGIANDGFERRIETYAVVHKAFSCAEEEQKAYLENQARKAAERRQQSGQRLKDAWAA